MLRKKKDWRTTLWISVHPHVEQCVQFNPFISSRRWYNWEMSTGQGGWNDFHSRNRLHMLEPFRRDVTDLQAAEQNKQSGQELAPCSLFTRKKQGPANEASRTHVQKKANEVWFLHATGSRFVVCSKGYGGCRKFTWVRGEIAQPYGWEIS